MVGIEREKRNPFRKQFTPIISQIEIQEIETAHKSGRVPMFPAKSVIAQADLNRVSSGVDAFNTR